jgi:hypothetical protein
LATFDPETRQQIDAAYEVRIETQRLDGTTRRTIIWVMVDGDDVFVRSVRGDRGHWFQAATDEERPLALIVGKERIPVRAVLAADPDSVARTTAALERKYANDPALPSMLRPTTLATTLRLEPV